MFKTNNQVIEGSYVDRRINTCFGKYLFIESNNKNDIINLTKDYISSYDIITEDKVKSASSAILRGIVGTTLLGGVGILTGLSAKNKSTYLIAIEFKDGNRSLIEIDQNFYKIFIKNNF